MRNGKRILAGILTAGLLASSVLVPGQSEGAAAAVKLRVSRSNVTVTKGEKVTIKAKNAGAGKLKVRITGKKLITIRIKKTKVQITGKKCGKTKFTLSAAGRRKCTARVTVVRKVTDDDREIVFPSTSGSPMVKESARPTVHPTIRSSLRPAASSTAVPKESVEPSRSPAGTFEPEPEETIEPDHSVKPDESAAPDVTPEPSMTPEPTLIPEPSMTPEPTLIPEPSKTPVPTLTPEPGQTPMPTFTPEPGQTPAPTLTPEPTLIPMPIETPAPTVNPTPEPTIKPTAAPTATAKPTVRPTTAPTATAKPTVKPTTAPTATAKPTVKPTVMPTATAKPTVKPTTVPTVTPVVTMKTTQLSFAKKSLYLGESVADLKAEWGEPERIDPLPQSGIYGYIYNGNSLTEPYLLAGVKGEKIVLYFTIAKNFTTYDAVMRLNDNTALSQSKLVQQGASAQSMINAGWSEPGLYEFEALDSDQGEAKVGTEAYYKTTDSAYVYAFSDYFDGDAKSIYGVYAFSKECSKYSIMYRNYMTFNDAVLRAAEKEVYEMTNAYRNYMGKSLLTLEERAASAARKHSEDMVKNNYFQHNSLDGTKFSARLTAEGISWRGAGENICAGAGDAVNMVIGWIGSSGHRNGILENFKYIGVGAAYGASADYEIYCTQDFWR